MVLLFGMSRITCRSSSNGFIMPGYKNIASVTFDGPTLRLALGSILAANMMANVELLKTSSLSVTIATQRMDLNV